MRLTIAAAIIAMLVLSLSALPTRRKTKDVKPVYPSESLQVGDEGVSVVELSVNTAARSKIPGYSGPVANASNGPLLSNCA